MRRERGAIIHSALRGTHRGFLAIFYALSCFARYPSFSLHPTQRFRALSRTNADATSRNVVACATDCSSPLRVFSLFLLFCRTATLRRYTIRGESIEVIRIAYSTTDASRTLKARGLYGPERIRRREGVETVAER